MNRKLLRLTTSSFAALGTALGLNLFNAVAPVELLSLQQWGQAPAIANAQDIDEEVSTRVYETARPAVVAIKSDAGTGTGSIISADGLILTNAHVIGDSRTVQVTLADGRTLEGQVVGYGEAGLDLAAVRISGRNFPTIAIAPGTPRVGQRAFALGNPFGLDGTFTTGIVSRIDTNRGLIQTDAAINPGNSGGPLLNSQGQLIGVNTSIYAISRDSGNIGIGFALAVEQVQPFLTAVRNGRAPQTFQEQSPLVAAGRAESITLNGTPIQGSLTSSSSVLPADNSYFNAYTFEGRRGQRVVIEMTSSDINTYLILLAPSGQDLEQDDDSAGGTNARLAITLPEDGQYTILANSYGARETGRYSLRASTNGGNAGGGSASNGGSNTRPSPNAGGNRLGSLPIETNGNLGRNSQVLQSDGSLFDEFSFQGNAGQRVTISLSSDDFDTYLILLDPDGRKIGENDDATQDTLNSALTVTLPKSGTYRVIANTYDSSGRGQYRLSIRASTANN
ncbi:MAG: trypsin-like peptidase domain-containing protein [Oculatellaceae cyanobacterium Prado106]|jgi:serine protease Do|nr:trypsin-like peptidase domain-containing protein [Oculatellaceae cyanobacterium Prado106]